MPDAKTWRKISNGVWCFGGMGPGNLTQEKGIMRNDEYYNISNMNANRIGKKYFSEDNGHKHSSRIKPKLFRCKTKQCDLEMTVWRPQSPDLSPHELAWGENDKRVKPFHPKN